MVELPFGQPMQLDFGQYTCRSGLKLYILAALLSASRYKYAIFQETPFKTIDVIQHLLNCFDYFGGITLEMVIDQDKLMVISENKGDIIYTSDFKYLIEEMDIKMYVCRKADPESNRKIERLALIRKLLDVDMDAEPVQEIPTGWIAFMIFLTGKDPTVCPCCGKGRMIDLTPFAYSRGAG